jgi:hypothetical protein
MLPDKFFKPRLTSCLLLRAEFSFWGTQQISTYSVKCLPQYTHKN